MVGFDVKVAKIAWTVFLVGFGLFTAYLVRSTLLVVVCAIFFSYLLYPLVELVERYKPWRFPRTASIAIVFLFVVGIIGIVGILLGAKITDEAVRLGEQLPILLNPANISASIPLPSFLEPQRAKLLSFISDQIRTGTGQALPFARLLGLEVMHAATNLIYLVLVPILSFLLIKEAPMIKAVVLTTLGRSRGNLWVVITEDLDVLLAHYVRALLILSLATFVIYSLAFSAMGVPYAVLLGGIAGILEILPFVGPFIAVGIVLAVSAFSGYAHLLWLVAFIITYRIFQDYVLNPYMMSKGVQISPLLVVLGLLAGENLGGVAGIFLSIPVLAMLKIVFGRLRASQPAVKDDDTPIRDVDRTKMTNEETESLMKNDQDKNPITRATRYPHEGGN